MEHEGTFLDPVFQFRLTIPGVDGIFPIIVLVRGGLVHGGSGHHARHPRDQGGGFFILAVQAVLDAHNAFIVRKVIRYHHLELLAHIVPHTLTEGRIQALDNGIGGHTAHGVEVVAFRLIKIELVGRIFHGSILTTGQGHGSGQGQSAALIPHHENIVLQIGDGRNLLLPVNGHDPKVGGNVIHGVFVRVFFRRFNHDPHIVPPHTGIFGGSNRGGSFPRPQGANGLFAVHVQAVEVNGFRRLENLPHGQKFRGGVGVAENFLTVLDEVGQLHREHLPFRPPTHRKGNRGIATIRQGGACVGDGNEVDISAGKNFVLHQEGAATKGHISSPCLSSLSGS